MVVQLEKLGAVVVCDLFALELFSDEVIQRVESWAYAVFFLTHEEPNAYVARKHSFTNEVKEVKKSLMLQTTYVMP